MDTHEMIVDCDHGRQYYHKITLNGMRIIIPGKVPSKKNSRIQIKVRGRTINIPSKDYTAWHKMAALVVASHTIGVKTIDVAESVSITFYVPDNRRRDLSNMAESVMDLLVDCKIIKDDCWQCVPELRIISGGIDKANPRAEISLKECLK
jgi:Holliday junction resolvase RusA-like endonuclease